MSKLEFEDGQMAWTHTMKRTHHSQCATKQPNHRQVQKRSKIQFLQEAAHYCSPQSLKLHAVVRLELRDEELN